MRKHNLGAALAVVLVLAGSAFAQVSKPTVAGVTNFAKLESTIACAGATTPAGVAEVKKLGYTTIINLRQANEAGAELDAEATAAKVAGVKYFHLPVNGSAPDPAIVDQFIVAVGDPANQPVFVHCASGNRAAALWMVKRLVVDGWDVDRASTEAAALGLTNPALKTFAVDYAASHKK
ncbi:MAG TPA: protein tyrosine phosphatase family protein [Vicinamibacterales bacterium]|nr:protein tyrosine phosphatase family protein [Vicinamibacterales bacterium]